MSQHIIRFVCRHLPGVLVQCIFKISMNQNVMITQWILQEIFCRSIHPYAGLCPAHIDIIRIFG